MEPTKATIAAGLVLFFLMPSAAAGASEELAGQSEEDVLAAAAAGIEEHRKDDAVLRLVDANGRPASGAEVAVELVRHAFLFGCNIYMFDQFEDPRSDELYKERFRRLFNYATVGFYWRWYERERGKPIYDYTDKVAAWCTRNGIRMKGHPLLWENEAGIPKWSDGQPPADDLKRRVVDIMTRYTDKIELWEVVNEPAHLPGLKIDAPYRWAREADPGAYLIVNDFHVLADGCPVFFGLLQEAIESGVPFDGIGIQAHEPRFTRFPLNDVRRILDRYALLGKELHITEFTPTSGGQAIAGSHVAGEWNEAAQADYAVRFYTVCFAHSAVAAITWWDLCDQGSWLPGGGLLRDDLTPKPAYLALENLIRERWTTKTSGRADQEGRFAFRGFYGEYTVRVRHDGKDFEKAFRVARPEPGRGAGQADGSETTLTLDSPEPQRQK